MKVVQTFWTGNKPNPANEAYGWLRPEYHLMSWVLCTHLMRKHYDHLVLYTDRKGKELFIDKLGLPYTEVKVELDSLNDYHPDLWALSKIHTYSQQDEPFLHVDGDVFTWSPFPEVLMKADLIAQNLEDGGAHYKNMLQGLKSRLTYFPPAVQNNSEDRVLTYNAGIFGGCDYEFYKQYAREAFTFVDKNQAVLHDLHKVSFNIFFEQYLYYCMLRESGGEVQCLFPGVFPDPNYLGFGSFEEVPGGRNYLHLVGRYKRNLPVLYMMECQLRKDFPEAYYQLVRFFDSEPGLESPSHVSSRLIEQYKQRVELADSSDAMSDLSLLCRDTEEYIALQSFAQEGLAAHMTSSLLIDERVAFVNPEALNLTEKTDSAINTIGANSLALVPEIAGRTTELPLDELDQEIITFLKEGNRQLFQLIKHLVTFFEGESETNLSAEFKTLITDRIHALLLNRVIKYQKQNQSFNLNHNNLGTISHRLPEKDRA